MRRQVIGILLSLTLLTVPAFAADQVTPEQRFKQQIGVVKKQIKSIDSATLAKWIEEEKDFVLVDVREASEVAALKIGAEEYMNVPRGVLEVKISRKIKELDTILVTYCLKGGRGALSTKALSDIGYSNVYNLDGGILAWIKGGQRVANVFGSFVPKDYVTNYK